MNRLVITISTYILLSALALTKDLKGQKLPMTSVRTGETEIFLVDPVTIGAVLLLSAICHASDLAGYKLLVASFRTSDTDSFVVDPETGDTCNLTRTPGSGERYPAW
jgi:hypothetical protein